MIFARSDFVAIHHSTNFLSLRRGLLLELTHYGGRLLRPPISSRRLRKAKFVELPHVGRIEVLRVWDLEGLRDISQVEVRAVSFGDFVNAVQVPDHMVFDKGVD